MVSRRKFFNSLFADRQRRADISSSLEEYDLPLSRQHVKHLLQRTTFAISPDIIDKYEGKTASELVDELFENAKKKTDPVPPPFVNDVLYNPNNFSGERQRKEAELLNKHRGDYNWEIGGWWIGLMKADTDSILEKMTLFWHGHLTTQYAECESIPSIPMFLQNDLFRKNFVGNFYRILEKITIDGAMLVYLNGNENVAGSPNENYARELMELYSLGVGNYSEADVKEAAKILTGWKIRYFADEALHPNKAYLDINHFDKNSKKFFDEVFAVNYEITEENVFEHSVKKLIKVLLDKKGAVAAKFMMTKLYKYFVYARPETVDQKVIEELADELVSNGFEFEPVLKKLFKSQHFFDKKNFGIQLKSPAETIVNIVSHFKYVDVYARNIMMTLGQELFNPTNVSGWKGYRSWVSTKSLPTTIFYIHEIFGFNTNNDFADWALKIDNTASKTRLTERIAEIFLAKKPAESRFQYFVNILSETENEWSSLVKNKSDMGARVKKLMEEIIKAPEFYLS